MSAAAGVNPSPAVARVRKESTVRDEQLFTHPSGSLDVTSW